MTIGVNYWPKFIISMAGAALAPPQSDRTSRRAHGQRGHLFSDKHPSFCSPLQRLFFLPALFNNILYTIHVARTLSSSPCWKPCTTKKPRSLLWCAEAGPACGLPHCGGFQAAATSCVLVSEFYYLSVAAVLPLQTSWRIMGEFLPACAVFRAHVCWRHQLLAEAA